MSVRRGQLSAKILYLHFLYEISRNHCSKLMPLGRIVMHIMYRPSRRARVLSLLLVALATLNYTHATHWGDTLSPPMSGMGRLGRDLSRKGASEAVQDALLPCEVKASVQWQTS